MNFSENEFGESPMLDTFDTVDGEHWIYPASQPDLRYRVILLLDGKGSATTDLEQAAGGVVRLREGLFHVFWFSDEPTRSVH
jgi:hypothetical protein